MPDNKVLRSRVVFGIISLVFIFLLVASPVLAYLASDSGSSYLPLVINAWPTPQPGWLLITEVMYDPLGPEPGGEWIELYNAGGSPLDLSIYKLGDEEIQGGQEGMYSFPPGASIAPGQAVVVAYSAKIFTSLYGSTPDYELRESDPLVLNLVKYTAWAGGTVELGDSGDEVLLLDAGDHRVDALSWGNAISILDPAISKVPPGHSLERFPSDVDTDAAMDWRDNSSPSPGQTLPLQPTLSPTSTGEASGTPSSTPGAYFGFVINEILADPHLTLGDSNRDGKVDSQDDEFVELVNVTAGDLDISGWSIGDELRIRHIFPTGSVVRSGCGVVIFGGGAPAGSFGGSLAQVASSGALLFNNDGDTVTLFDLGATGVISYTYGTEGGDDQSLTRSPEIFGLGPLVKHASTPGSDWALFSPGVEADGDFFSGCILH